MAGLPGTGKSAIARALALRLNAAVLDKDIVRAALFAPDAVEYTSAQDDFVIGLMLETARYLFGRDPSRPVILDGRTYSKACQLHTLQHFAAAEDVQLKVIECVCEEPCALERIERGRDTHPARNRNAGLYYAQKAAWEGIPEPKCVLDTMRPLEECVAAAYAYVTGGDIMAA